MMRSGIKWSLIAAATIVLLTLVVVELVSWNFLKPRIETAVEHATGRNFDIEGDVEVGLFPRPGITLHEVTLANPDWAEPEHFLEVDRVRAVPDLLALLTGTIALARLDVDHPVVRLIGRADGPANWVFSSEGEAQREDAKNSSSQSDPLPIHRVNVDNADIHYRPAGPGEPLRLSMPRLVLRDDGESAALDAKLSWHPCIRYQHNTFASHLLTAAPASATSRCRDKRARRPCLLVQYVRRLQTCPAS